MESESKNESTEIKTVIEMVLVGSVIVALYIVMKSILVLLFVWG